MAQLARVQVQVQGGEGVGMRESAFFFSFFPPLLDTLGSETVSSTSSSRSRLVLMIRGFPEPEGLSRPPGPPHPDTQQLALTDAFNRFDWNAFMDDFDWSFTSSYLQPGIS